MGIRTYLAKIARSSYRDALRSCTLDEIQAIGRGRKVEKFPFPYVNDLNDLRVILKNRVALDGNLNYVLVEGKIFPVCYSRSKNFPAANIDLWLDLGKNEIDYLIRSIWTGSDMVQRGIGIPIRKNNSYLSGNYVRYSGDYFKRKQIKIQKEKGGMVKSLINLLNSPI